MYAHVFACEVTASCGAVEEGEADVRSAAYEGPSGHVRSDWGDSVAAER